MPQEQLPAEAVNWGRLDVGVRNQGRHITIPGVKPDSEGLVAPADMPIPEAIAALQRKHAEAEQEVQVHEIINAFPYDGLVAFVKAMQKLYGWASPVPTQGFWGPRPPNMLSVKVGPKDTDVIQCPFGSFKLPGISKAIGTAFDTGSKGEGVFVIHGVVKTKEKHILLELATETRRIVKAESIYRGKALRLAVDEDGNVDLNNPPEFIDVSGASRSSLIFDEWTQAIIDVGVYGPIEYPNEMRQVGVFPKSGILVAGEYGTGKTELMRSVAKVCVENGVTFVLLDNIKGMRHGLEFTNRYAPGYLAGEDFDRITEDRDEECNQLINMMDGVLSKDSEVSVMVTTNHPDRIQEVALRPGRIDLLLELKSPNAATVERLLRHYAGEWLPAEEKLDRPGAELAGQIPATIAQCVQLAKKSMVVRRANKLSAHDLMVAAKIMAPHLAKLNKQVAVESEPEKLAKSLKAVIGNGHDTVEAARQARLLRRIDDRVEDIHNSTC